MKNIVNQLLMWGGVLFLFSCSKLETPETPRSSNSISQTKSLPTNEQNEIITDFAYALSVVISEEEARILIKDKANLKFDGTFDVLYSTLKDFSFSDNETFEEKIINA